MLEDFTERDRICIRIDRSSTTKLQEERKAQFHFAASNLSVIVTGAADEQILQRATRLAYLSRVRRMSFIRERPRLKRCYIEMVIADQTAEMWPRIPPNTEISLY